VRIGLVAHPQKPTALRLAREAAKFLGDRVEIVWESTTARLTQAGVEGTALEELEAEVLLAFGGDGTFLHLLHRTDLPLLPVHAGTVGFLAEVDGEDPDALRRALDDLVQGRYHLDHRMRLALQIAGRSLPDATNEVVLHTNQVARMRHFEILVDGEAVGRIRADGLIVATPTGSTSYSLSALGPIVEPGLEAIVVTALAPFQVTQRAVVLDPHRILAIRTLRNDHGTIAVVDGQTEHPIDGGVELLIYRSPRRTSFVRFGFGFFRRLQGTGILPWREETGRRGEDAVLP
jgi:NAD+ kinase